MRYTELVRNLNLAAEVTTSDAEHANQMERTKIELRLRPVEMLRTMKIDRGRQGESGHSACFGEFIVSPDKSAVSCQ